MGERKKTIKISIQFHDHLKIFFSYGVESFGQFQAIKYIGHIYKIVEDLERWYALYPECRYLKTKERVYRNIILDSYLIIYRINKECIEVLDIVRSESSIRKIRDVRKTKL